MKILFFIESLRAGGKERRIVELLKGLKKQGNVDIELVLTRQEIHYQEVLALNIPVHFIERKFFKKDPLLFFKFFKIAKKFKPDVIHVWGHMVAVYAVPAKWLLKVPMINNEITDTTPNQKLIGKEIVFRASDRIIANTQAGIDAYQAPPKKSGVIYNGFNFDRLKNINAPDSVRNQFSVSTPFVVGMVASFLDYKDYGTYIQAALRILKERIDVTFLCIGDGDDGAYRNMVPEPLQRNIRFLGKQNRVESIMNICMVGVLTTNIKFHGEGISNALMEFMALGKPVIATNFGGSVELIEENMSGYLIEAFNAPQLAEKILYLIQNNDERERVGKNAFKRIEHQFSIDTMIKSFYEEYVKVLRKKKDEDLKS